MIRFGIATWCLDTPGPSALARAGDLGLTCVQIDFGTSDDPFFLGNPAVADAYRRSAAESGVEVIGLGAKAVNDIGMVAPQGSQAQRQCQELMFAAVTAAAALNIRLVFFPSFRKSMICDEMGLRRTAQLMKWVCAAAAPYGILIASENSLDERGNLRLVDLVGETNFRILIDSYNPVLFKHRVPPILEALGSHIADQVHAKDGLGGEMGNVALGRGEGYFHETVAKLRELEFNGCIVLENKYRHLTEPRVMQDLEIVRRLFGYRGDGTARCAGHIEVG